jgi:alpha-amylase
MINSSTKKTINAIDKETARNALRTVPYEKGFHFFMTEGHYSGETAISLLTFAKELEMQEIQSIRFHFERDDFQKWIRTTIEDEQLAQGIDKLPKKVSDEDLRKQLVEVLQKRLSELQSMK